jgi:hypothetical protein
LLAVYNDDLVLLGNSPCKNQLQTSMYEATMDLVQVVEVEMSCEISIKKTNMVASSDDVLKSFASKLGVLRGKMNSSAVNLGIDIAVGRTRSKWQKGSKRQGRSRMLQCRIKRLAKCRKKNYHNTLKVLSTGLFPGALYGAELHGVNNHEDYILRQAVVKTAGLRKASMARSSALMDHFSWRATAAPIIRFADEVWQSVSRPVAQQIRNVSLSSIRQAWVDLQLKPPKTWGDVRGPMGAVLHSLRRIQWQWTGPFEFIRDDGALICLTKQSPAMKLYSYVGTKL